MHAPLLRASAALGFLIVSICGFAQGTAFTYQGRLIDNGVRANGSYDLSFALYDASANGDLIGTAITNSAVTVSNGLFTTSLDFGAGVFTNSSRWLEISERTNGSGNFTLLTPRQALTAAPYATVAGTLAGTVSASQLSGAISLAQLPVSVLTNGANGVNLAGTFSGDGSGVTNVPGTLPWQVVTSTSQMAAANRNYLLTNNAASAITLPASANIGDLVTVSGTGTNGWNIYQDLSAQPWTAQNSGNQTWYCLAASSDGTKLVAAAGTGFIYTSTDSGTNWTAQNSGNQNWQVVASSADGIKLVAMTGNGAISTSSDSGTNWTDQSGGNHGWDCLASSADGTKLVAAGVFTSVYTSTDSGVTWTAQNSGSQVWLSVASSADGIKLIAAANGGVIYTSTDSGTNWTRQNNLNTSTRYAVASSADGTKLVAAGFYDQIYTSVDSGTNWTAENSGVQPWNAIASSADGSRLAATASGSPIYISIDSGVTWTAQNSGDQSWDTIASSADGIKLTAAVYQGQIYTHATAMAPFYTGLAGTTTQFQYLGNSQWQPVTQSASQVVGPFTGNGSGLTNLNASQISSGTIAVAQLPASVVTNMATGVTLGGIFNGNLNGTAATATLASNVVAGIGITNAFITNSVFAGNGGGLTNVPGAIPQQVVAGTNQTAVANQAYLLTNNAASSLTLPPSANVGDVITVSGSGINGWTVDASASTNQWTAQNIGSEVWTSVASSADGTKLAAVAQGSAIYTSTDSGVTWTAQNSGGQNWGSIASSADGTKLVAVAYNNQIYTSTNSGTNWTAQFGDGSQVWWSVASSADGTKLVAVDQTGQIYTSTDSGTNWTGQFGDGSQNWYSIASSADGTKLVAVAFPGQIYTSTDSGVTWTAQNSSVQFWISVASSADGTKLAAASGNGLIYTSTDSGVTWTAQNSGSQRWQAIASSADGTKLVAAVFGGQIYLSTDSGTNWTAQAGTGNPNWNSVAASADGTKLVAVINGGSIYTYGPSLVTLPLDFGSAGTTAQFQYTGSGQWQTLGQSAGALSANQLPATVVTNTETGVTLSGTFNGNGSGLTSVNASSLGGSRALLTANGILFSTNLNMLVHPIYLKNEGDVNHGLGHSASTTNFTGLGAPDGPILWGYGGGALGSTDTGGKLGLIWTPVGVNITGTLRVGTNYATVGAENVRIIRGTVNGTTATGSGFTVSNPETGKYIITFNSAFSASPTVTASGNDGTLVIAMVVPGNGTQVGVNFYNLSGTLTAPNSFNFIAVGQ